MARVETEKIVNPAQLSYELNREPVKTIRGLYVECEAVDESTLASAVDAHDPQDDWQDPNPPLPGPEEIADANQSTLETRIQQALTSNANYLTKKPPTQAEVVQQVRLLTRQVQGLIRLQVNALNDISDTE